MSVLTEMAKVAESIVIIGHVRPDGDCVGSGLATYNYLTERFPEKEVAICLELLPVRFQYLGQADRVSHVAECGMSYDLCICVDCGDTERLGGFISYYQQAKHTLCVDHHITNCGYGEVNVIDAKASSTCEVLFDLMDEDWISLVTAECLYTGILHDTNVFKNSNTSAKTMMIAGRMMAKGINFSKIIDESFYQKTYVQNQIMARAVLESVLILDGRCIFSAIRECDMAFYNVNSSDLDGIVEQLRITAGVECAIFLCETANQEYKVSMRSKYHVDVSKVASYFGGGGHVRAAGCQLSGSVHDVINNLSGHIEQQLKEQI